MVSNHKAGKPASFFSFKVQPLGLAAAAGTVACACTVLSFLDRFWWGFELTAHFPVQYFVVLALFGVLFALARRYCTTAVFTAFAVVNLAVFLPIYLDRPDPRIPASRSCRAMLANVRVSNENHRLILKAVGKYNPDLLVLAEVNEPWIEALNVLKAEYGHTLPRPRIDRFGIALFSKMPLRHSEILYLGKAGLPSLLVRIDMGDRMLTVLGTHPRPPLTPGYLQLRNEQLEAVATLIEQTDPPVIVIGDLNVTPWSFAFRQLLKRTGLRNSAKGRGLQPTWPAWLFPVWIPIDHLLHSEDVVILNRIVGSYIGSDHYPVIVDFALAAKAGQVERE